MCYHSSVGARRVNMSRLSAVSVCCARVLAFGWRSPATLDPDLDAFDAISAHFRTFCDR